MSDEQDRPDSIPALLDKLIEEVREKDRLERTVKDLEERVGDLEDTETQIPSPSDEDTDENQKSKKDYERESKIDQDNPIQKSGSFDKMSNKQISNIAEEYVQEQDTAVSSKKIMEEAFDSNIYERDESTKSRFYNSLYHYSDLKKDGHPDNKNKNVYFDKDIQYKRLTDGDIPSDIDENISDDEYELRKYAIGKLLPEEDEYVEVARTASENSYFESFSKHYKGDGSEVKKEAWDYICTNSDFKKRVQEDLDTEFEIGFENRGKHMVMVISR